MPTSPRTTPIDDDDELDELAPLEEGDDVEGVGEEEGLDDDAKDDSRDDSEAGDAIEEDALDDDPSGDDAEDEREVDVGEDDVEDLPDGRDARDDEAPGVGDEPIELVTNDAGTDDWGEEGTTYDGEEERDDLPPLDGEDDDEPASNEEPEPLPREAALPPWEDAGWSPIDVEAPRVSLRRVIAQRGLVTAVGDALLEIPASSQRAHARPMAAARGAFVALTQAGAGLRLVADASGGLFLLAGKDVSPLAPCGVVTHLAATSGEHAAVVARTEDGELSLLEGGSWHPLGAPSLSAIASDGGTLVGLSSGASTLRLASSRDAGRSWEVRAIEDVRPGALAPEIAVAGDAIAMSGDDLLLARGADAPLEAPEGCERCVAVAFAGTNTDAPLLALLARDDGVYLVRVDASNEARLVADLTGSGEDADIGEASMAWDDVRGVVWIASAWGLLALTPPR